MKKGWIMVVFLVLTTTAYSQLKSRSFEVVDSLQQLQKRKVIVFIHADWCSFCQTMKQTTFKNKGIIESLNSDFYFVDFNGEDKRDIAFNKQVFKFRPTGINVGAHELAMQLGRVNKQLVYPVLCVLNEKNEIILQYNNYLDVTNFKLLLEKLKE
jgi:thioredoxin-related protein